MNKQSYTVTVRYYPAKPGETKLTYSHPANDLTEHCKSLEEAELLLRDVASCIKHPFVQIGLLDPVTDGIADGTEDEIYDYRDCPDPYEWHAQPKLVWKPGMSTLHLGQLVITITEM